jgi:hypothetical protein
MPHIFWTQNLAYECDRFFLIDDEILGPKQRTYAM